MACHMRIKRAVKIASLSSFWSVPDPLYVMVDDSSKLDALTGIYPGDAVPGFEHLMPFAAKLNGNFSYVGVVVLVATI